MNSRPIPTARRLSRIVLGGWAFAPAAIGGGAAPTPDLAQLSNTAAIGQLLYTKYIFFFQVAGFVLLVAMIGAIVLTLRHKVGVKRQVIADQVARSQTVELHKVEPGRGI